MKDLIGIRVRLFVDGVKIEGLVVGDRPDRVLVQTEEGKPAIRIPKAHISFFTPEKEPEEQIPLLLLFCNRGKECPGVFYLNQGNALSKKTFDAFMGACPFRNDKCQCGSHGDVRVVSQKKLAIALGGLLIGDYPKEKKNG